jgi:hypothetical protein
MDALHQAVARGFEPGGERAQVVAATRDMLLEPILGELLEFERRLEATSSGPEASGSARPWSS